MPRQNRKRIRANYRGTIHVLLHDGFHDDLGGRGGVLRLQSVPGEPQI